MRKVVKRQMEEVQRVKAVATVCHTDWHTVLRCEYVSCVMAKKWDLNDGG